MEAGARLIVLRGARRSSARCRVLSHSAVFCLTLPCSVSLPGCVSLVVQHALVHLPSGSESLELGEMDPRRAEGASEQRRSLRGGSHPQCIAVHVIAAITPADAN